MSADRHGVSGRPLLSGLSLTEAQVGPKGSRSREARRDTVRGSASCPALPRPCFPPGCSPPAERLRARHPVPPSRRFPPMAPFAFATFTMMSAPPGLLLSRSPLPPLCCQSLGPVPSWALPPPRSLPRSLAPRLRALRPLMALASSALVPGWARPPAQLTCSVSPLRGVDSVPLDTRVNRRGVSGLACPSCLSTADAAVGLRHGSLLRSSPGLCQQAGES